MSHPNTNTRSLGEPKSDQGNIRLNRKKWLRSHDFEDPFPENAVQAEGDEILEFDREVFVPVPYYDSVLGTPEEPGYHFIFGQTGAGKTTIRKAIKFHYDDLLGKDKEPQVLVVVYNSFTDASSILASNSQSEQALYQHHIEKIVEIILFRLLEVWSDKKKSARLRDVQYKDIKKQIRWYIQKYLRLFPWQFERMRKEINLRSYLPLFHYLIRVLLGALKTLFPPVKPLAEALGQLPSRAIDDHVNFNYSGFNLLSELVDLCSQIGFDSVYVLVDDLDNGYSKSKKNQMGFKRICPLLLDHKLYSSIDQFVLKLFMPHGMKKFFVEAIDTGKMLTVDLDWTKDLIQKVYEQRLRSCRLNLDVSQPSLADICSLELRSDVDNAMVEYGTMKKTPRALIELGFRLLDEHFSTGDRLIDDLVCKNSWERALKKAGRSSVREEVGLC